MCQTPVANPADRATVQVLQPAVVSCVPVLETLPLAQQTAELLMLAQVMVPPMVRLLIIVDLTLANPVHVSDPTVASAVHVSDPTAVSYTHLTLPTNREV